MNKTMERRDYEREVFRKAMNDGDAGYARDFVVACEWSEEYVASQLLDWFLDIHPHATNAEELRRKHAEFEFYDKWSPGYHE